MRSEADSGSGVTSMVADMGVRKFVVWLVILAFNLNQVAWAQPAPGSPDLERSMARLDRFMSLVDELRSHVDRSQFDTEALLEALDHDETKIVAFVRDEIRFEQYPGLLRGARGTLSSRAGNALDQAVLLAGLLKDAGFDARIVRGVLSEEQARKLLDGLAQERAPVKEVGDTAAMIEAIKGFCRDLVLDCADALALFDGAGGGTPSEKEQQLMTRYTQASEQLFEAIAQAGFEPGQGTSIDALVAEARDYFWVEFRTIPGKGWEAAHPAFGNAVAQDLVPKRTSVHAERVPDDLLHKIRFEVVMQQQLGTRQVSHRLIPPWERPAANLALLPVSFQIASSNFVRAATDPALTFDPERIESDLFFPRFPAGQTGVAFDFAGNAIPLEEAASMFAGVFQETSKNFNLAAGALGQLGGRASGEAGKAKAARLDSIIAYYTIITPDGKERQYQRTIHDSRFSVLSPDGQRDPAKRNEEAYREITRLFTFQVHTGSPCPAQVFDAQLEAMQQRRPGLKMILAYEHKGVEALQAGANKDAGDQASWTGHAMLATVFDALPGVNVEPGSWRDRPNLVVHHKTLPIGETIREAVDIVQNGRRAYARVDGVLVPDSVALVKAGVWETATEGALLTPDFESEVNTVDVFLQAGEQSPATRFITDAGAVDALQLPLVSAEALKRDLSMGYAAVLPVAGSGGPVLANAWWRIDPATGETLGMGFSGEGAEVGQYSVLMKFIAGTLLVVIGTSTCMTWVYVRGKDFNNLFTCMGVSTAAVMAPYAPVLGFLLGGVIALLDIELDFERWSPPR